MKKLLWKRPAALMAVLLWSLAASAVSAQPPDPEMVVQRMQAELELTDEQTNAVFNILTAAQQTCAAAETQAERHDCMHEQGPLLDAQIEAYLTPEQFQKFKAHRRPPPEDGPRP